MKEKENTLPAQGAAEGAAPAPAVKKPKKKRSVKKMILIVLVVAVVGLFAVNQVFAMLRGPQPTYVSTAQAATGSVTQTLSTTGTLRSANTVNVLSPVTAPLSAVNVQAGQKVKQGDALFAFDTTSLQRVYRQASATWQSGQLQKEKSLSASSDAQVKFNDAATNLNNLAVQRDNAAAAVSSLTAQLAADPNNANLKAALEAAQADLTAQQTALTTAKATYDAAEQGVLSENDKKLLDLSQVTASVTLEGAKEDLDAGKAGVSAPISGVVTSLTAVQGGTAAAYGTLCTIESMDDVYVDIALSRYDLEKVAVGQTAQITTLGNTYDGVLESIDAMATSSVSSTGSSAAYVHARVKVTNPGQDLRLGIEANVVLSTGEADNVITVPLSAVNTDVDGTFCYIVENGIATRCAVETGISSDTLVEIKSGLSGGEDVITNPADVVEGAIVSSDPAYMVQSTGGLMIG